MQALLTEHKNALFKELDKDLEDKIDKVQKLMEEMMDDETKKLLEELQKSLFFVLFLSISILLCLISSINNIVLRYQAKSNMISISFQRNSMANSLHLRRQNDAVD